MSPNAEFLVGRANGVDDPLEGDRELRMELANMFLEDCPKSLTKIRAALTGRDAPALKIAAHTLKGSAGVFQDIGSVEAALRMEHLGRDANWEQAEKAWGILQGEMARLTAILAAENHSSS